MKTGFRFLLVLLALLALFSSCSRTVSFSIDPNGYRNGKTGVVYTPASDNYRALKYDENARVGAYSYRSQNITFYRVEGMNGILTDEDFQLYVSGDASLPAFSEFSLTSAALCMSDAITVPVFSFDAGHAEQFRRSVLGGVSFDYGRVNRNSFGDGYKLVFYTSDLPIVYQLIYQELTEELLVIEPLTDEGEIPNLYSGIRAEKRVMNGEEVAVFHFGTQFLYDRSSKNCYPIEKLTSEGAS